MVIVCYGFKGFKGFAFFPYTSRKLCERGFGVVPMNFSGNGIGDDPVAFTELDTFAQNTFSQELDDLESVFEGIATGTLLGTSGNPQRLGITGHSRGGCTAIIKASPNPRLKCLVTCVSPATVGSYAEGVLRQWKEQSRYNVPDMRTKEDMFVNYSLIEDIQANRDRDSLDLAVARLTFPYLVVHRVDDESISVEAAHRFHGLWEGGRRRVGAHRGWHPQVRHETPISRDRRSPSNRPLSEQLPGFSDGCCDALLKNPNKHGPLPPLYRFIPLI